MMVLCAACLMSTMAFEKGTYTGDWPIVTLAMTAKFLIGITFTACYTYSVEVFPTMVRNVGMGSSSSWARIGSILAPLTFPLSKINPKFFPTGLLGLVFLFCSLSFIVLPETFRQPLYETIQELEEDKKEEKIISKETWKVSKKVQQTKI